MKSAIEELEDKGKAAKAASRRMADLSTEVTNKALANIADALLSKKDEILAAVDGREKIRDSPHKSRCYGVSSCCELFKCRDEFEHFCDPWIGDRKFRYYRIVGKTFDRF